MLATTIIDPLLSSPTQVQRHDDDMAVTFPSSSLALQTPQLMDSLTYSTSYSSEQNDDDQQYQQQQQQQFMDSLTYSTSKSTEQYERQQQEEDEEQQQGEEEDETPFEQLMNRGNYLRQLRALALQDEMERRASTLLDQEEKKNDYHDDSIDSELCDHIYTISTTTNTTTTTSNNSNEKVKVLEYNSYLAHQRYYDDLKHVDITYMDYGIIPPHPSSSTNTTTSTALVEGGNEYGVDGGGRVVIEQRKRLGKGGFCWDAAFMLGEHVIAHEEDWNNVNRRRSGGDGATVLELGAGTGLCGIMIGKATKSQVTITDLPELEELMGDNVRRNFGPSVDEDGLLSEEERKLMPYLDGKRAKGTVTSRVLRWGVEEDYFLNNDNEEQQAYDVIIGADIVASLYDPVALAQTLHALCGPTTKIYISSKSRLDKPHETFDAEMARLFEKVEKKVGACSRLKNPNVFIIQAEGKR